MRYACYEPGYEGVHDECWAMGVYENEVDHGEYPDYEGWLWDMLRVGIFYEKEES